MAKRMVAVVALVGLIGVAGLAVAAMQAPPGDVTQTFVRPDSNYKPPFLVLANSGYGYVCIRKAGGTSTLELRFWAVGGVDQLLKSVAVPNPTVGVPFTIRCQVTATEVIGSIDGVVKVTFTP